MPVPFCPTCGFNPHQTAPVYSGPAPPYVENVSHSQPYHSAEPMSYQPVYTFFGQENQAQAQVPTAAPTAQPMMPEAPASIQSTYPVAAAPMPQPPVNSAP